MGEVSHRRWLRLAPPVSSNGLVNIAFCLASAEVFFIYRNFRMPDATLGSMSSPLFGSFVAVIVAVAMCFAMLALYMGFQIRVEEQSHLKVAALCSSLAPLGQLVVTRLLDQGWAYLPCIVITSIGCACFLPEMVKMLASTGVTNTVKCSIACCIVLLVAAPVSSIVPFEVFILIMCIFPAAIARCVSLWRTVALPLSEPKGEGQRLPWILLGTIFVASVMEGVVAGVDELEMTAGVKMVVFSAAYVGSALLMFATLLRFRVNFNGALYRQCIPLMAAGLAIFALEGALALNIGTLVFLVGRQLFVAVTLALVVYLVKYLGADYYLLSLGAAIGATLGSFVGSLLFNFVVESKAALAVDEILPGWFVALVVLVVLVASMYLMNASNVKTRWGMTAIDDSDERVGLTLEQSCRALGDQHNLTKRERELFALMARGKNRQAIAEQLFISEGTVKVHTRNIYQKMGIHSRQDLINLVEKTEESIKE